MLNPKTRIIILTLLLTVLPLLAHAGDQPPTLKALMEQLHSERGVSFVYDATLNVNQPYGGKPLRGLPLDEALRTLFAHTGIDFEVSGNHVLLRRSRAVTPPSRPFTLNPVLKEIVVDGDLSSPVIGTQMGRHTLTAEDISTEFSLLSSPDVVKSLQHLSGVQEGVEMLSGLYVHGGNADENLFLIDGSPLYSVNHAMGLFSSFNTDVVQEVDFYKSGFPARYGGRLSSVVDVRNRDGDMERWKGLWRVGLLDGSFQIEGPLQKHKTALNLGLRRSWLDMISTPAFKIGNLASDEEDISASYLFFDLNAKVTHMVNDRSRVALSIYAGQDRLTTKYDWHETDVYTYDNEAETFETISSSDDETTRNKFRWGNVNATLDWATELSPRLKADFAVVYTHNRSRYFALDDYRYTRGNNALVSISHDEHASQSDIHDAGYRATFDFRPLPHHHVRFGQNYTLHLFRPQTKSLISYGGTDEQCDTTVQSSRNRHTAHEWNLYAEDLFSINDHWSLNTGLNLSLFGIKGKTMLCADPRVAVKYQLRPNLSVKASYTMMTQYVHKITNSLLELPTDYWVPTTARLKPMHSHQLAVGSYAYWGNHWQTSIEAYYKRTRHLLQYSSWSGLEPPAARWDTQVMDGEGRFYGVEMDATYRSQRATLTAAYTLSWNERHFAQQYSHWYPDKFDNRHKLTLTGRFLLGRHASMYAAWTFHSGNRMTLPTQYAQSATLPIEGADSPTHDTGGSWVPGYYTTTYGDAPWDFVYEKPNNTTLPAYHRLDVGFDFRKINRHGHERIWNLSVYNAYCHLNTMWTEVDIRDDGRMRVRTKGFIPIIPSFSYTVKF